MQRKIDKAHRALQKSIPIAQADSNRPRYHFAPPANWMNDPNGTIYHQGEYHLFYQFNPTKETWGNLHWGHAKSKDLVHWEHLPIALAPDGFPREMHCWSGCCVIADDDTPIIFYTSMNIPSLLLTRARRYAQQWLATGSPDLVTWEKHPANPILREKIHGDRIPEHWRDPYVWRENDRWFMVLCGQYSGEQFGRVFLYQSPDLWDWKYVGILSTGTAAEGRGWECPNYFKLGEKYMLVVSPYGPVIYSIGDFDGKEHHTETWYTLDHGKDFYATNTYIDGRGRMILVGWVKAKGDCWNGCLSLPRELKLEDDRLIIRPVEELQALRDTYRHVQAPLEAAIQPIRADRIEIRARFEVEKAASYGFKILDDENEYWIAFEPASHQLQVLTETAELQFVEDGSPLELHIFIDHSVIEVYINEREVFTVNLQPVLADNHSLKIEPFIDGGKGLLEMDIWQLTEARLIEKF
jgi:beta-fructofuranosidase